MSAAWSLWGFLLGLLGLVIYLISRRPITNQEIVKNTMTNGNYSQIQNQQITIPDTCPQCKNPNTKLIRLCEWCGSQIC